MLEVVKLTVLRTLAINFFRMKSITVFLFAVLLSATSYSQKTTVLKNLWTRPQVHVLFNGYTISFAIRDINRTLLLLNETGDFSYGTQCNLDTAGNYYIELYDGTKTEYKSPIQPLIQNAVGCFLFTKGKAVVKNPKNKQLSMVEVESVEVNNSENFAFIHVFDPKTHKLIFSGKMAVGLFNMDMGIDYY